MVSEKLIEIWKKNKRYDKLRENNIEFEEELSPIAKDSIHSIAKEIVKPKNSEMQSPNWKKYYVHKHIYLKKEYIEPLKDHRGHISKTINKAIEEFLNKNNKSKKNSNQVEESDGEF